MENQLHCTTHRVHNSRVDFSIFSRSHAAPWYSPAVLLLLWITINSSEKCVFSIAPRAHSHRSEAHAHSVLFLTQSPIFHTFQRDTKNNYSIQLSKFPQEKNDFREKTLPSPFIPHFFRSSLWLSHKSRIYTRFNTIRSSRNALVNQNDEERDQHVFLYGIFFFFPLLADFIIPLECVRHGRRIVRPPRAVFPCVCVYPRRRSDKQK